MAYLDKTGLAYFWGKLKALLEGKLDKSGGTVTGELIVGGCSFTPAYSTIAATESNTAGTLTTSGLHCFRYGRLILVSLAIKGTQTGIVSYMLPGKPAYSMNAAVQIDTSPYCTYATVDTAGKFFINILVANQYHRCTMAIIDNS